MTDPHDHDEEPQGFIVVPPWMAHQHEMAELHRGAQETLRHDLRRLLQELPKDHLIGLCQIIAACVVGQEAAAYVHGLAIATLDARFGVCHGCGKDHDALLADMAREGKSTVDQSKSVMKPGDTRMLTPFELQIMNDYQIDDLRVEETGELIGFRCMACQRHQWATISERMELPKDPAGNCPGCILKTRHG